MFKIGINTKVVLAALIFSGIITLTVYLLEDLEDLEELPLDMETLSTTPTDLLATTDNYISDSEDEFRSTTLDVSPVTGTEGSSLFELDPSILHIDLLGERAYLEYSNLTGYIKYNTNRDYNYNLLVQLVPAHLQTFGSIPDVIDNDVVSLITKIVTMDNTAVTASMTYVSRLDDYSVSLFLNTATENDNQVWMLGSYDGYRFIEQTNLENGVLVHLMQNSDDNILLYIGTVDGTPAILAEYRTTFFVACTGVAEEIHIAGQVYAVHVEDGVVILSLVDTLFGHASQGGDIHIPFFN